MRRARPELPAGPLAITAKTRNALRLAAVDTAAGAAGLAPGFTLKEARRIAPGLLTEPEDAGADRALASRLLALCRLTAPAVARDGPHGFVLDVTGAARIHGGEQGLAAAAAARFAAEGVAVRWTLADTPGLAWAVTLFGNGGVVAPGEGRAALAPLPVEALRLSEEDTADLRALGFRRIGPVMERPRSLLASALEGRLGARLDLLLGHVSAVVAPVPARARYVAERTLAQPIVGTPSVLAWTRRLLKALQPQLLAHGRGARSLELVLTRADGERRTVRVRTRRPHTDPDALIRLFEGPLAAEVEADREGPAPPGAEIEALRLEARFTAPLNAATGALLSSGETSGRRFEALVESLSARLGADVVEVPRPDGSTLKPERQVRLAPLSTVPHSRSAAASLPATPAPVWGDAVLRPVRLFDPPEPATVLGEAGEQPPFTFLWRRRRRRVVRVEGPERLEPEWGREPAGARARDYYRVEDETGRRYWLFREGLYGRDAHPAWFVQGVLA